MVVKAGGTRRIPGSGHDGFFQRNAQRQEVFHAVEYRVCASADTPVIQNAGAVFDMADAVFFRVITVGETSQIHGVTDKMKTIGSFRLTDQLYRGRMQMDKVGDNFAGNPGIGENRTQNTGIPVMEGRHAVKGMGGDGCAAVDGGFGCGVVCASVAKRNGNAQFPGGTDDGERIFAFRRNGNEADDAAGCFPSSIPSNSSDTKPL